MPGAVDHGWGAVIRLRHPTVPPVCVRAQAGGTACVTTKRGSAMTQPGEQPEEMHEEHAPAGTPVARHVAQNAAPVWDRDGTEWQPVEGGYAAVTTDPVKGRLLVMDVGAIPEEYQPTYAQPPTAQQRELADLADEIEGEHPL